MRLRKMVFLLPISERLLCHQETPANSQTMGSLRLKSLTTRFYEHPSLRTEEGVTLPVEVKEAWVGEGGL